MELYVHIPFCLSKCNYCDFLSAPADESVREQYVNTLIRELSARGQTFGRREVLSTIYFGGGTPSVLSVRQLEAIMNAINREFTVDRGAEITIEVNPGSARDKIHFLKSLGFNRLSIGLQSIHKSELAFLGRIHSYEDFLACYTEARDVGFSNINVDVMTAFPGQTEASLAATLNRVMDLGCEHISAYSLQVEEGTPFYERFKDIEGPVVGEENERKLYWMCVDMLKDRGYKHYEISNFAKPGYESRHNSGYWKREYYLGVGLGASSCIAAPSGDERNRNTTDLSVYFTDPLTKEESVILTKDEMIQETIYLGLRMMDGVDTDAFVRRFGVTVRSIYGDVIDDLAAQGLIYEGSSSLSLTDLGIDYGNHVFASFLK